MTLRDGSVVVIRRVTSQDAPLLAEGFARLSLESRQLRFLTSKSTLSAAELRYFTEIDHHDHEALGALDPADGRGLGIARYIRSGVPWQLYVEEDPGDKIPSFSRWSDKGVIVDDEYVRCCSHGPS